MFLIFNDKENKINGVAYILLFAVQYLIALYYIVLTRPSYYFFVVLYSRCFCNIHKVKFERRAFVSLSLIGFFLLLLFKVSLNGN
jgi:hypothetical protein